MAERADGWARISNTEIGHRIPYIVWVYLSGDLERSMNYCYSNRQAESVRVALFFYLWTIVNGSSVFFYIFYENFYFVDFDCGRVDKLFIVANGNCVSAKKSWVALAKFIVWTHRDHITFSMAMTMRNGKKTIQKSKANRVSERPSKKWNEMKWNHIEIVEWLHFGMANSKKFNQFNCICECIQCNSTLSQYCFAWLRLCSVSASSKGQTKDIL